MILSTKLTFPTTYIFRLYDFCKHIFRCQPNIEDYNESESEAFAVQEAHAVVVTEVRIEQNGKAFELNASDWDLFLNFIKFHRLGSWFFESITTFINSTLSPC